MRQSQRQQKKYQLIISIKITEFEEQNLKILSEQNPLIARKRSQFNLLYRTSAHLKRNTDAKSYYSSLAIEYEILTPLIRSIQRVI